MQDGIWHEAYNMLVTGEMVKISRGTPNGGWSFGILHDVWCLPLVYLKPRLTDILGLCFDMGTYIFYCNIPCRVARGGAVG